MTLTWTTDQILALAPDAGVLKSGNELASPRKWQSLNIDPGEQAAWGECKGSAKNPYQAKLDLTEPAFHCTCPSRKFPCKHTLALFLMLVTHPGDFTKSAPPQWVVDWLTVRAQRAQKRAARAQQPGQIVDPAAQAKRAAKREAKVAAGIEELDLLLHDVIRSGLADASTRPYSYWENVAARMVDAQAPGLARQVRQMNAAFSSGDGWPGRVLEQLGKMHLLIEGYRRLDTLPPGAQADINTMIGFTLKQEELLAQPGERDQWLVLGQRVEQTADDEITQRTWLWGMNTGRAALSLSFSHGNQPFDKSLLPNTSLDAELVFYPSAYPQRAILKQRYSAPTTIEALPGYETIASAIQSYAEALTCNPWLEHFPILLKSAIPVARGSESAICDPSGESRHALPVASNFDAGWQIMSLSGGHPVAIFGEWDGSRYMPVSLWTEGRYVGF